MKDLSVSLSVCPVDSYQNANYFADVKGEEIRKDITNGEKGIKMTLAIQVVDYKTCQVVPNAYVDIWSSNSTVRGLRGLL